MKWMLAALCVAATAQPIPMEKQRALGRAVAEQLRREAGPAGNAEQAAFVQRLGRRLAGAEHFEFSLIGADGPAEPVGLPGRTVLVPVSLFRRAAEEAEFAAMVAHAMAHSALHHGWVEGGSIPLYFGQHSLVPQGFREQAERNELEADRYAMAITARAGYDAAGLLTYLRRERAQAERVAALERIPAPGGELGGTEYLRLRQTAATPKTPSLRR